MIPVAVQDILFDDFALLEKHIGRQSLIGASVNANCDCASSPNANSDCVGDVDPTVDCDRISHPSTAHHDDYDPNQITPSAS